MHFWLRSLPRFLVGVVILLTGVVQAGESDDDVDVQQDVAGSPQNSADSFIARLRQSFSGAADAPMGEVQQKQLFASLLDHMQVHVSARLLDQLAQQPVEREFPVEDTILGVEFSGRAKSTSVMRVQLAPADDQAVFEVILTGIAKSKTIGKTGPVCLHCEGVTRFTATKRFHLTDEGVAALPVQCKAETNSTVTDITSTLPGLRGRIATRIASRRSDETHAEAERISAQHHEESISQLFDEQMARLTDVLETTLANEFLRGGSGDHPQRRKFHFHTSRDYLCMGSVYGENRTPAPPEPKSDTLAKLWLPTAFIDLPLALTALQAARTKGVGKLWHELTGRKLAPSQSEDVAAANSEEPPLAVNVAVESGWLSLSMKPR